MIEIAALVLVVLCLVIASLIGVLAFVEYQNRLERAKFINALIAKNAYEAANLDMADKTEIKVEKPKEPDLIPVDDLSDEEFKRAVGLNG